MAKSLFGQAQIRNSVIQNVHGEYKYDIYDTKSEIVIEYSNFWKNSFLMPAGEGNIAKDPLFGDRDNRDYHLKSTQGHWEKLTSSWVIDDVTNPCIDIGFTNDNFSVEPIPNGNIINIGVYGGTEEASKSPASTVPNRTNDRNTVELTIYPNPFSVSSSINYSSHFANHMNITVYDLQGKRIKTLLGKEVSSGYSSIQWNGTNSQGQKITNGIYYVRLVTGTGFTNIVKILF